MHHRGTHIKVAAGVAGLSLLALTIAAEPTRADEIPENLKGEGEVVITTGGGTWEDAQREAFFDPFERDTGIEVVLVPENHAKLLASVQLGAPEADITSIPGGMLAGFDAKGALAPIDYGYFDEETLASMPGALKDEKGVGALLYSIVVAYNADKYPEGEPRPANWADFYDLDAFPGTRGLPKCEKIIDGGLLETALMGDGVPMDRVYPIDMDRAFAKVAAIKPEVARWWVAGADAPQGLIDGELDVSSAYNGRIYAARQQGAPLGMSWDQSLLQYDYWVVMKGSPNEENAMKFLAYISRPEPQAAFAEAISYGPVNNKAYELIPEGMHDILPGSPRIAERQLFQDYRWWNEAGPDGRTNWDVALERCVNLLSQ